MLLSGHQFVWMKRIFQVSLFMLFCICAANCCTGLCFRALIVFSIWVALISLVKKALCTCFACIALVGYLDQWLTSESFSNLRYFGICVFTVFWHMRFEPRLAIGPVQTHCTV